ncbi:hypothetical protein ACKFKG_27010 [Phormidesmis sp. 146-35]
MQVSAKQSSRRWLSVLVHCGIVGAALAGIVWMQRSQLNRSSLWTTDPQQAERQEALRLDLLKKTPSFGFDNMIANWTFLNFLQYFGDDEARDKTGYSLSPQYFDLITRRDPRFVDIYLFLSGTLSYQLGKPQLSVEYLRRGTEVLSPQIHPRSYTLWQYQALDQLLLLGDIPGAIYSSEQAAKWAAATPGYEMIASNFQRRADFLRTEPDSKLIRFQSWGTVFDQAQRAGDRKTQERAKQEILALGGVERVAPDGRLFFTLDIPPKKGNPSKPAK